MGMCVGQDHRSEGTQIRKKNNWFDRLTHSLRVNNVDEDRGCETCSIQVRKDVGRSTDEGLVIAENFVSALCKLRGGQAKSTGENLLIGLY